MVVIRGLLAMGDVPVKRPWLRAEDESNANSIKLNCELMLVRDGYRDWRG